MRFESLQFGTLEFDETAVVEFSEGLLGFPQLGRMLHLRPEGWEPVEFLLPLDEPRLTFPIVNPYLVRAEYEVDIPESAHRPLGLESQSEGVSVYVVTTFGKSVAESTVNLLAPVLINPVARRGRQIVLEQGGYSVTERLVPPGKGDERDAGHSAQVR